jgi:DNA-binding MarR family transcriptional regulator
MTDTTISPVNSASGQLQDLSLLYSRIEAVERELRKLKHAPSIPLGSPRLNKTRMTAVQEDALRALLSRGEMTAEEVAKAVNRTRPLMVVNLNQLVALGLLDRERKGKRVYFRQKISRPSIDSKRESGGEESYMFVVLASDGPQDNTKQAEQLLLDRLRGLSGWNVEHVSTLPRVDDDENEG